MPYIKRMNRYKRPKRITEHQRLVNEAGDWVREIVLQRQHGECLRPAYLSTSCGGGMQGAHILRKGAKYNSIRFDLENVIGMCRNHHIFWAHQNELDFYEWIEKIYPGRIAELKQRALENSGKIDLKLLICVLRDIAKKEGS
jgi:hypothetical protein